jgi:HEAT repeat protein
MACRENSTPSSDEGGMRHSDKEISSLIRNLGDPDPQTQWRAAEELGRCGSAAVPRLTGVLGSPSVPVRLGALEALGTIRDPRSAERICRLLDRDASLEVRWAAALALGEIGPAESAGSLIPLLRDRNRYLRYGAATALCRLGWKPENSTETAYLLIAHQDWDAVPDLGDAALPALRDLLRDDDPATRAVIVSLIGRLGGSHEQAVCTNALRDRDPRVRWSAVLAAMNCGVAPHDLPLMVAGRERTGPDPAAAALLNFLFLGIGYNYIGKWWGFPVFMAYMSLLVLAQLAMGPFLPYLIAYPLTALAGVHTYYLAERISDL